jgi:hypothetical protein
MAVDTLKQQGEFLVEASKQAMAALISGYAPMAERLKKTKLRTKHTHSPQLCTRN